MLLLLRRVGWVERSSMTEVMLGKETSAVLTRRVVEVPTGLLMLEMGEVEMVLRVVLAVPSLNASSSARQALRRRLRRSTGSVGLLVGRVTARWRHRAAGDGEGR